MAQNMQPTARQRYYKEQQRRKQLRRRFFGFSFVCILLLSGVITFFIELPGMLAAAKEPAQSDAAQSTETDSTVESQLPPSAESEPAAPPAVAGTIGPVLQTNLTYTSPSAKLVALPENGRVDMDYFSDALFIGDSLTQGFQVYASGISNAHYAAYVGVGPKQLISGTVTNIKGEVVTAIDEILTAAPKKVYILLGTNALPLLEDEAFLKYYNDFLDFLAPQLPAETVYYLQGIPPVTQQKAESSEHYNNTRIAALNEQIAKLAYVRGWHYVDLPAALADEAGTLRVDVVAGTDGIHLNGTGYEAWKEYLVTHTAYSKTSPYIAGSPYLLS